MILAVWVVASYQPVWDAGYVWDDDSHRTQPELQSCDGLMRIWIDLDATQQYYPLTHTVFWVQHRLWGDDPLGYHLLNVGLHIVNALLVLILLGRLRVPGAALVALVFALHPVMVESVAWITELKNTLSGLCYLSAALAYLRFDENRQKRWYAAALVLFVLGLLSKTVVATLPGALLVVFWWQRGRLDLRRDAAPLIPFFVLGAAAGLFTALVERHFIGAQGAEFEFSMVERLLIAGRVAWFYVAKLVWPVDLSFIYARWEVSQAVWWQYAYPLAAALVLAAAWRYRQRNRAPLAAMLFFGGTLLPALGFINVYPFVFSLVADHFQYLASLGMITLVVSGAAVLARRLGRPGTFAGTGGLLLVVLSSLTWRQARLYHDRETLWQDTLAKNPACWMAHNNLGKLMLDRGRITESITHFESAIRIRPHHVEALTNLGVARAKLGSPADAIRLLRQALHFKPDYALAHNNLGLALTMVGRIDEGISHFEEAVRLDPEYVEAHYNHGVTLSNHGRPGEAVVHLEHALRLQPEHVRARMLLGQAMERTGRPRHAAVYYEQALRLLPDDVDLLNNLAWLRATAVDPALRDGAMAIRLAERAVELTGSRNASLLDTLAAAYAETGRWSDAIVAAETALDVAHAAGQQQLADTLQVHLERYRATQPWREPAKPTTALQVERQE